MDTKSAPRVLFVEDEAIIALVAVRTMRARGYSVDHAREAEEALELFARNDYALVVTDIELGSGMDGVEAAKRMLRGKAVPLLFYTGEERDEVDGRAAGLLGFYDYLRKSPDPSRLIEAMELCLQRNLRRPRLDLIGGRPEPEDADDYGEESALHRQRLDLRHFLRDFAETGKRYAGRGSSER